MSSLVSPAVIDWLSFFVFYISCGILALGLIQCLVYLVQVPLAAVALLQNRFYVKEHQDWWLLTSDIALPISIVIPTYNEETTVEKTLASILGTQYPSFEVIVVNDGSTDRTLKVLQETYQLTLSQRFFEPQLPHTLIRGVYTSSLYPQLVVVDKPNGGRADALNAGVDVARHPLFCTLDADSLLDPSALLKTVQPFLENPDRVVATGGTVRILNGCQVKNGVVVKASLSRRVLPLFQIVEYIRAFLMGRMAWSSIGIITIISGAFSVFRKDIALQVGGFSVETIGEDFELVMKVHKFCRQQKRPYEIRFVPEPVCWTEAPEALACLRNQRIRWQQGALEVFFKHRDVFMNPRYGRIGMVAMPLTFIFDVAGPIAELIGYIFIPTFYLLGVLNVSFMFAMLGLFIVFGIFVSTMALVLEEISLKRFNNAKDLMLLAAMAVLENFGYRQLNNVWRIIGWWRFIRRRQEWGYINRGSRE